MTIYRVATPPVQVHPEGAETVVHVQFASSAKGVRAARKDLAAAHECKPSEVQDEALDIRRGKSGLLEYLNAFHTQVPGGSKPPGYPKGGPSTPIRERKKRVRAEKPVAKKAKAKKPAAKKK